MLYVLTSAATAWLSLLVAGPWLGAISDGLAGAVYLAGSLVCHQQPERSFHLAGAQLPVCARCLGLYAGGGLGLLVWAARARGTRAGWRRSQALRVLALAAVPTAVSVATAWAGLGDPPNVWRALLALPLGTAAGAMAGAVTTDHLK
jgi:uncharacterized membrane protein